ncbi:uncharacterized protein [Drosophila kikkawai]|uniref:Uncharacterized protein isoform X2 n=1 Tax=Drosophila kikkawai TaxID=30033 RepID=A0A6P4ICZ3_DROKI|nr:uncharacterized protein LOC108073326 isoform X2 [Drosophila kikkawai]
MAYSGIPLPGIVSPDESVEEFAKLYGNNNVGRMMIMASTIGNPYGLPGRLEESYTSEYFPNLSRPGYVDDRYVQASHGPRTMRRGRGGYGDYCNRSPAMGHSSPRYSHQQEGWAYPRPSQGSGSTRHGGYGDHYSQRVYPLQQGQFSVPEHQSPYSFPAPERYPWL